MSFIEDHEQLWLCVIARLLVTRCDIGQGNGGFIPQPRLEHGEGGTHGSVGGDNLGRGNLFDLRTQGVTAFLQLLLDVPALVWSQVGIALKNLGRSESPGASNAVGIPSHDRTDWRAFRGRERGLPHCFGCGLGPT